MDVADREKFDRLFTGVMRRDVVCRKCGRVTVSTNVVQELCVSLKLTTVTSVADYFKHEVLANYNCSACEEYTNANSKVYPEDMPKVLTVIVNRFGADGRKNNQHVEISEKINVAPFCRTQDEPTAKYVYKFVAAVNHHGAHVHAGHYTASAAVGADVVRFDDRQVMRSSLTEVQQNVYVLFYELENPSGDSTTAILRYPKADRSDGFPERHRGTVSELM